MAKLINLKPFINFLKSGAAGGLLLLACVAVSLTIANTTAHESFVHLLEYEAGANFGSVSLRYSIESWINDGLMAVFFLMVGLEIKRELVEGELSSVKQAALPIVAAFGGAILPAFIYHLIDVDSSTSNGWGIPMATDIAFALAVITLLGKKVPPSLKIFLAALAIVDDLIAILVIAIFYSSKLHFNYLGYAGIAFGIQLILNFFKVQRIWPYLIPAAFLWYFIHHSGIHATIAGVLTAFTLPTTPDDSESALERLEHLLMKPVNYIIMPLFALANTNIHFVPEMVENITSPLSLAIMAGLLVGKPVGIFTTCWLMIKTRLGVLPQYAGWWHLVGVGVLGGIGFTMSVFIALLSFKGNEAFLQQAKFSILLASLVAGVVGFFILKLACRRCNPDSWQA